ncbi:MAG: DUF1641 domain-containing protein [Alicyclobacillus sp.]|nr:DUF1641 domain-containing protein [Alicyclobacillus sp.]
MAKPVTTVVMPVNTESEQQTARLAELRAEAAAGSDALQAAIQLLQALHERGVLELLTALFARGDRVLHSLVELLSQAETVRAIQNTLALAEQVGRLDPQSWERCLTGLTAGLQAAAATPPPERPLGLFELLRQLKDPDVSAGLATGLAFLRAVGRVARVGVQAPDRPAGAAPTPPPRSADDFTASPASGSATVTGGAL